MLHELLLALLGYPGGLITETEDTFQVSPRIDFLSAAEIEQINRVVSLGALYKRINAFLLRFGGISP